MYFTSTDYDNIEKALKRRAIKDSEFVNAKPLKGNEVIALVQDYENRKLYVRDLVSHFLQFGDSDFINISNTYKRYNITLIEAIRCIPDISRKIGQVITFLNESERWVIYQFIGELNQWNNPNVWKKIFDNPPYGISEERPTLGQDNVGYQYFDTTLNKPIYWTGTKWVDSNGVEVE
jgi:hypothetical protein